MARKVANLASLNEVFCKENTKNEILSILSKASNLTGLEIFLILRKNFGKKLTYQAIHKALQELVNAEILAKENKKYFINSNWLKKLKKQVDSLAEALDPTKHAATIY